MIPYRFHKQVDLMLDDIRKNVSPNIDSTINASKNIHPKRGQSRTHTQIIGLETLAI